MRMMSLANLDPSFLCALWCACRCASRGACRCACRGACICACRGAGRRAGPHPHGAPAWLMSHMAVQQITITWRTGE